MPRYIEVDELLNKLPNDLPYKASVKRVLIQAPTADVVPKSEVEKWQDRCRDWHEVSALKSQRIVELEAELAKTKAEIAREIFEEIEFDVHQLILIIDDDFDPDKVVYDFDTFEEKRCRCCGDKTQ